MTQGTPYGQREEDQIRAELAGEPLTAEQRKYAMQALTALSATAQTCATLIAAGNHDRESIRTDLDSMRSMLIRIRQQIEATP